MRLFAVTGLERSEGFDPGIYLGVAGGPHIGSGARGTIALTQRIIPTVALVVAMSNEASPS